MRLVKEFVQQIIVKSSYELEDETYLTNRILALVGQDALEVETKCQDILKLKDELLTVAVNNGTIGDLAYEKEILGAVLMDFITPSPSHINHRFWTQYEKSPQKAIAEFHQMCQDNDYIKVSAVAKNIAYTVPSQYGDLEITINLSKPEKDPKEIALAKESKAISYPKCQLCFENEGYQGRIDHPARANHRVIRFSLDEEIWGFQYSPYAYFNEHCIYLNRRHLPMTINKVTFDQLLSILDVFPDYFVGSNADLPIVGGSILTHNHYQGGRHIFPMEKAICEQKFTFNTYPNIEAGIVKWPMSVIRLKSKDKDELTNLAEDIRKAWRIYSDDSVDVIARTDNIEHHTVTPIARKRGECYELDLVLRDNHTTQEFPDGVFHPHKDIQHIKKENIGLIEVMGLAILPPRLKDELKEVEKYLLNQYNEMKDYHRKWADDLKQQGPFSEEEIITIVQKAVGEVFVRVLEDAGVFKRDFKGQSAFLRFIKSMGIREEL